jgi:hypothetical protein
VSTTTPVPTAMGFPMKLMTEQVAIRVCRLTVNVRAL